jgi:nucleoid-associated protein YgaU
MLRWFVNFLSAVIVGLAVFVGVGVAVKLGIDWYNSGAKPRASAPPGQVAAVPPSARPEAAAPAPAGPSEIIPSFDAVRIAPDGRTVIAGRAVPGAEVTVLDNGQPIGTVTADPQGEWVLTPDQPLPPGAGALSLVARQPGASETTRSEATVAVIVPERQPAAGAAPEGSVAVLLPRSGEAAPKTLQLPSRTPQHLVLDIVEYKAAGDVDFSGRADPAAKVEIYVNDGLAGSAATDASGNWAARLGSGVPVGRYHLRLKANVGGQTIAELAIILRRAAPGELASGDYIAVVPGNNLWHFAQRSYGEGMRYVEIYRANQQQIADPDLIYPGQLLALPEKR